MSWTATKAMLAAAAAAAGIFTLGMTPQPAHAATCGASGPFTESGDQIHQGNGSLFVAHGVTVSGLENGSWKSNAAQDAQEIAAAPAWCANLIRLQVSEQQYAQDGAAFRAELKTEVDQAESLGLAVVINDNDEWDSPAPHGNYEPTAATEQFWNAVAPQYARDPQVIFDIFNEPRTHSWVCWRDGGAACSSSRFIGMNELARYVRARAPRTLLWIDGPGTLAGLGNWWISVSNPKAYSIHHPPGAHDSTNWWHQYGWLAKRHKAAVVDGEWTNWAAARSECWTDAATAVPAYLHWMRKLGIGMTVWTFAAPAPVSVGVLTGTGSFTAPTSIGPGWACRNGLGQSAGSLIQKWYQS